MALVFSLLAIGLLATVPWLGVSTMGLDWLFGIVAPYAAMVILMAGLIRRVIGWARAPVPFRVPTTCGQQRSLPWIKYSRLDNPSTTLGVLGRMALEVVTFRSLFRNTRVQLKKGGNVVYGPDKLLWAGALAFHFSFLAIFVRHYRFFVEPVPQVVALLQGLDGFFQVGVPIIYLTDIVILAAIGFLLVRRLVDPRLRYISLAADYLPLFILAAIAASGVLLRYFVKTDTVAAKDLAISLVTLSPVVPQGLSPLFFVHVFLVSVLFAYLPFSKLSHLAGVFFSPMRNLANNNRMRHHANPWNAPVNVHTYAEWEEEFHDKIKAAGLPLERE
jgi:nitrate reductase gamma subunit